MNAADSPQGGHQNRPGIRPVDFPPLLRLLWLVPLFLLQLTPCAASSAAHSDIPSRTLLVDGRQVPVFATPEEQLRYARSTFDETEEKSAALKAQKLIHPGAREHVALAALELAFLSLGDDYRLADRNMFILARNNYLGVLEAYPDLPAIAAKALWYLGWIACDLEGDRQQGIRWYQRLITLYPDEKLSLAPPVPWLTIRADPDRQQHAAYPKAVLTWTDMANLEIVRHTVNREQAWQSFNAIRRPGGNEPFVAAALKVLVERHGFDEKSEGLVREYLQKPDASHALKNDLLLALSVYRREADAPEQPR